MSPTFRYLQEASLESPSREDQLPLLRYLLPLSPPSLSSSSAGRGPGWRLDGEAEERFAFCDDAETEAGPAGE